MRLEDVKTVLRKKLKREPTYDDVADALNGCGMLELREEIKKLSEVDRVRSKKRT